MYKRLSWLLKTIAYYIFIITLLGGLAILGMSNKLFNDFNIIHINNVLIFIIILIAGTLKCIIFYSLGVIIELQLENKRDITKLLDNQNIQ